MTDLTPEQVERWAADESAAEAFGFSLQLAFSYLKRKLRPQSTEARGALHAHAKMLQQQAAIERLTNLIEEHNRELGEMCDEAHRDPSGRCQGYNSIGKDCPGCPKDYTIDTQDGVK